MDRPKIRLNLALVVLAALLVHGFCLQNPWYMDDSMHLLKSRILNGGDWWDAGWRRWSYLVWSILLSLFGGSQVAFHALNLVLHAGVAVTVFFAARSVAEFCEPRRSPGDVLRLATVAGLLFAVHPAASEPVHYAAQATIQWATLFSMLAAIAVLSYLRNPSHLQMGLAVLWIVLAANSKEPGVFHAGMGVVLIVGALAPWKKWMKLASRNRTRAVAGVVLVVLAGGLLFIYSGWLARAQNAFGRETFGENVLTQCRMTWRYLLSTVFPVNLCSDHLVAVSISRNDVAAAAGGVGIGALLAVIVGLLWKQRIVALLMALALAPILIRFAYPVQEYLVEYRLYPAMPWFAVLFAFALQGIVSRKKSPAALRFLPHAVLVVLAVLSVVRARDWRSPFSIGENVLARYPNHVRVHSYLQAFEIRGGEPEKAIARQEKLRQAAENLIAYNKKSARHHRRYDVGRVLGAVMAGEQMAGLAEIKLERPQDALRRLDSAIAVMKRNFRGADGGKGFGVLYRTRGKAHAALDHPDAARTDFERALKRIPNDSATLEALKKLERGESGREP